MEATVENFLVDPAQGRAAQRRRCAAGLKGPGLTIALPLLVISFMVFAQPGSGIAGRGDVPSEYDVKAAFIIKVTQFVDWPPSTFPNATAPICIGVLGNDPFGASLDRCAQDTRVGDRGFVIKRSKNIVDLKDCQLLFICQSEAENLPQIFTTLGEAPVLTISEIDGFARRGGTIRVFIESRRLRFEINNASAKRRRLTISSGLLDLGRVVG